MADTPAFVRLDGDRLALVFALTRGGAAELAYAGPPLPVMEDLAALCAASARGWHESQADTPQPAGLMPERKGGYSGSPGLVVRQNGRPIDTDLRVARWQAAERMICVTFEDKTAGIEVDATWQIASGDVISSQTSFRNLSSTSLALDHLASLALHLPDRFDRMTTYCGRWAGEMRETEQPIYPQGFSSQSAIGKPGFGGGNWLLLHAAQSNEVIGVHLAWSGDYDTRIDCDDGGTATLQMAASWDSGEVELEPGASFESVEAIMAIASDRNALARAFHTYLRKGVLPACAAWGPRKTHLNSWEALGFNLSEDRLIQLASDAAALGIERFVLDDGWFGGRRNDRTSLGDWFVSRDVLPRGLGPLIDHVLELGLDFGLWVEPEMVSPDSDLYRAHPNWCVHIEGRERSPMRGQLTLDLTIPEVAEYLFERIDTLLTNHPIAYLKWDHNRDLFPSLGKRRGQALAFYALIDRIRAAHPKVEIETCSSGGGRIDFGVLARTHRVWPSDNNDAIERGRIMRAWSQFLPLEVLGNHVGPSPNPITGRQLAMDFRAKTALFGHMGVEADPAVMDPADRKTLTAHIALYKHWRDLLHSGALHQLTHPASSVYGQLVTNGKQALALVTQTEFAPQFQVAPVRLAGLDPDAFYKVTLPRPWPGKAALYLANHAQWLAGFDLSGKALMTQGLALPLTHPETAWLVALERLDR